jgi:hypothetical protein
MKKNQAKIIFIDLLHRKEMLETWTTFEEDYIALLLPAPKCTNYIKQVLMLELSKTDT